MCRTAGAHQLVPGDFCGRATVCCGQRRKPTRETDAREDRGASGSKGGPPPLHARGGGVASIVKSKSGVALPPRLFALIKAASGPGASRLSRWLLAGLSRCSLKLFHGPNSAAAFSTR